jgi:hypothetical protein
MGLFSSQKKITVATQVSRVIVDKMLPNSPRTGVYRAIVQEGDIADHLLEEMLNSVALKAEQMYDYAAAHSVYGLPTSRIMTAVQGQDEIQEILDTLEGVAPGGVTMEYSHLGPPNNLHIAWMALMDEQGYNPATNQLGTLSTALGRTVYLQDMVVVVPVGDLALYEPGALDQWGPVPRGGATPWRYSGSMGSYLAHRPVSAEEVITEDFVRVSYVSAPPGAIAVLTEPDLGTFEIPITGYDSQADYFHVRYTVGGVVKFWMYRYGAGTYPTLDTILEVEDGAIGSFFPFNYFRFDSQNENEDTESEAYTTSKKMAKYLGLDYDLVADAIDANPDIDYVTQAILLMAVPADTQEQVEIQYLFDFFNALHTSVGQNSISETHSAIMAAFDSTDFTKNAITIQDSRFKLVLANGGIHKRRVTGTLGAIGTHAMVMGTREVFVTEYVEAGEGPGTPTEVLKEVKTHLYRRQVNHAQYDEVEVVALKLKYFVEGGYAVTADETDDILLIPLDHSLTNGYKMLERELLYARSLHFVFNSVLVTKIAWYQTGLFQFVMIVVAVIVTIYTMGADGGAFLAAVAAGSTAAIVATGLVLLQKILIGLVIGKILTIFVKAVGVDVAIVLAVIAAAYGVYDAMQFGSITGAPWAADLLQLASGLAKSVNQVIAGLSQDLLLEASEFSKQITEQTKTLDSAQELLENSNRLSPFVIFGESPNDFYNRSVHAGNIGAMGIQAISSYVDAALTLPKLNDTLGES